MHVVMLVRLPLIIITAVTISSTTPTIATMVTMIPVLIIPLVTIVVSLVYSRAMLLSLTATRFPCRPHMPHCVLHHCLGNSVTLTLLALCIIQSDWMFS